MGRIYLVTVNELVEALRHCMSLCKRPLAAYPSALVKSQDMLQERPGARKRKKIENTVRNRLTQATVVMRQEEALRPPEAPVD